MSLRDFVDDVRRLQGLGEAFAELDRRNARQRDAEARGEIELVEVSPGVFVPPRKRSPMQRATENPFAELAGILWPHK